MISGLMTNWAKSIPTPNSRPERLRHSSTPETQEMISVLCHAGSVAALLYNMWISFRVLDDWGGFLAAILGLVLFPITTILLPIVMLFVESSAAGPLALWPGIVVIGLLQGLANRSKSSKHSFR